jgi:hypothetical protein
MLAHEVVGIAIAFIILAGFVAAISPKSQAGSVIKASSDGFNQVLGTAISPVTGG